MNTKRVRICIVSPSFYGGGAEKIAVNLSNYYSDLGYSISLIVFNSDGPYRNDLSEKVTLIDLSDLSYFSKIYAIRNFLKKRKDIVEINSNIHHDIKKI